MTGTITWTEAAEITKKSLDDCLANNYELYKNSRMLQLVILLMMCISIRALTCR